MIKLIDEILMFNVNSGKTVQKSLKENEKLINVNYSLKNVTIRGKNNFLVKIVSGLFACALFRTIYKIDNFKLYILYNNEPTTR